jgi:hypothetical protein
MGYLTQFIDASKVGGWARAGAASLLAIAIGKWPGLGAYLDPATQAALGVVVSGAAVGVWSQLTKTDTAKLAAVAALPDVTKIIVKTTSTDGVAAAAADPAQPKITTATPIPTKP